METTESRLSELERVVVARQDWLFRFAYMRIGCREDAEDVVQNVLLRLFQSKQSLTDVDNVEKYLVRCISNACTDYFRHRPQQIPLEVAGDVAESNDERRMHSEYMRISRMLRGLPAEQAETVRLHCIDGLNFRQIAELQQLPEATVKSRYRYAIQHIQKELKSRGD